MAQGEQLSRFARVWTLGRFPFDSGRLRAALRPCARPRSGPSSLAVPCSALPFVRGSTWISPSARGRHSDPV